MSAPRLVLFAGRPGTGKTTLARETARHLGAIYLRIDSIEAGLRRSHLDLPDLMDAGYTAAQAVAEDALALGQTVVADAVHGHAKGRSDWEAVAAKSGARHIWFHVICSDPAEHKSRIDARAAAGATRGGDWSEITTRALVPPSADWPVIDTAGHSPEACLTGILGLLDAAR